MSSFRKVEDIDSEAYITAAIYRCKTCSKKFNSLDEQVMERFAKVPSDVFLLCPVKCFKKSCWTTNLVSWMTELITQTTNVSSFVASLSRCRTTRYIKLLSTFKAHQSFYRKQNQLFSAECIDEEIGDFFLHCGYNGSLGPSPQSTVEVFSSNYQMFELWNTIRERKSRSRPMDEGSM